MLMAMTYSPSQCRALRRVGAEVGTNCAVAREPRFKPVTEKPGTRTAERENQKSPAKTSEQGSVGSPQGSSGAPGSAGGQPANSGNVNTGGTSGGGNAGGNGAGCSGSCGNGNGGNGTGNQGGKP
jgi:hypothetical protein